MTAVHHTLLSATPGTSHQLLSLHYGTPGAGPKVVVQAALHADEVPAILVAQRLRAQLEVLEAQGADTLAGCHGVNHVLRNVIPTIVMCDRSDIGEFGPGRLCPLPLALAP